MLAALVGGVEAVSLAILITGVAIGQAGMGSVAGMLARAISYWVASLLPAAGRATLKVTMQVNGGEGSTGSAVQTRLGLGLSALHDLCAGLLAQVPRRKIRVPGGWG